MSLLVHRLQKFDFKVTRDGRLRVTHPAFRGKNGIILFNIYGCPECQDTKVEWSADALRTTLRNHARPEFVCGYLRAQSCAIRNFLGEQKKPGTSFPSLKYIRKDGIVVDYEGPLTYESLSKQIYF